MVQCLAKAILVDSFIGSSETITICCRGVICDLMHEELAKLLLGVRYSSLLGRRWSIRGG